MSKINIDDPDAWSKLDWDEPIVPEILKRSDHQVNRARANRLKANDPLIVAKISKSLTGKSRSAEVCKQMSERQLGVSKGPCSEEAKEKNRQSNLGKKRSEETKLANSKASKIIMNKPEVREANSKQATKRLADPTNNPNYKGKIIGIHVDTNERLECIGPKDFVKLDINYFTVLKRIKSGKAFKGYTWTREAKT